MNADIKLVIESIPRLTPRRSFLGKACRDHVRSPRRCSVRNLLRPIGGAGCHVLLAVWHLCVQQVQLRQLQYQCLREIHRRIPEQFRLLVLHEQRQDVQLLRL